MIGRSAYKHPLKWSNIDEQFYGNLTTIKNASSIILTLLPYIEKHVSKGGSTWDICKHLINIVENIPNAKKWRNKVAITSIQGSLTINKLKNYALELEAIEK